MDKFYRIIISDNDNKTNVADFNHLVDAKKFYNYFLDMPAQIMIDRIGIVEISIQSLFEPRTIIEKWFND